MAKKLTAGVLNGSQYTETMQLEWNGEKYELEIKPLTNKQASEIEVLLQEGISIKGKPSINGRIERLMDFDMRKNTYGRYKANVLTVVYGTVDEAITEKVVENEFPPKLIRHIAERIRVSTGIGQDEDIENFNEGLENPSE